MKLHTTLGWFLVFASVGLVACETDSPVDPGSDSDAGPIRRADSGPRLGGGDDAGAGTGECEAEIVDPPAGGSCAAATQTCVQTCKDETCYEMCLAMDPMPDECGGCLDDAFVACANAACQAQWDAMICCFDAGGTCAAEESAYDACADDQEACFDADAVCFM
jgi:hypothetical protein